MGTTLGPPWGSCLRTVLFVVAYRGNPKGHTSLAHKFSVEKSSVLYLKGRRKNANAFQRV